MSDPRFIMTNGLLSVSSDTMLVRNGKTQMGQGIASNLTSTGRLVVLLEFQGQVNDERHDQQTYRLAMGVQGAASLIGNLLHHMATAAALGYDVPGMVRMEEQE